MKHTNALQLWELFKPFIENIGFSENLVHRFTIKKDILLMQNTHELTNLIVDTFSKPLVFLRESVIKVTTSFWKKEH